MTASRRKITLVERLGLLVSVALLALAAVMNFCRRGNDTDVSMEEIAAIDSMAARQDREKEMRSDTATRTVRKKRPRKARPAPAPAKDMSRDYFADDEKVN